jgi:hypothetical protein
MGVIVFSSLVLTAVESRAGAIQTIMKWQATLVLISFCTLAVIASAQSSMQDQGQARETQARGYWVDLSTGLMWVVNGAHW